jgi:DNA polymerase-3 subunit beta
MQTIQVSANAIRALAANVAPKGDTNPVISGVLIAVDGHGVTMVATNRAILAAIYAPQGDYLPRFDFILPREAVAKLKADKRGMVTLTIDPTSPVECRISGAQGGDVIARCVEGTYPDWRRVIPQTVSGEPGQYNPALLAALNDCYRDAYGVKGPDCVRVHYNGASGAAVVTGGRSNEFIGGMMPMRHDEQPFALPEWIAPAPVALAA